MEYGIVVQLNKAWWPRNLLEYPFTHWTYMFKPDGTKVRPPVRLGVESFVGGVFSPDGKWFAYEDFHDQQVYVMRVSDKKRVKVSNEAEGVIVSAIKWLGDGHTLAYGDYKVYIQDISCLAAKKMSSNCLPPPKILKLGANASFYDISPDGKRIIYTYAEYYYGKVTKYDIFLMETTSSRSISLKAEGDSIRFVDNTTILIYDENDIYIAEVDDNGKVTSKKLIAKLVEESSFPLSPDGKYIAIISSEREDGLGEPMWPYIGWDSVTETSSLFVMELATGQVRRLTYPNDHEVIWYDWYPLR